MADIKVNCNCFSSKRRNHTTDDNHCR